MIGLHLDVHSIVFFSFAALVVLVVFVSAAYRDVSAAYRDGADDMKKKLSIQTSTPQRPLHPADRFKTLPTPDGLGTELMTYVVPGHRIEVRLACCKVKDCGAVLLTPREYYPDAMKEDQYATEQGWLRASVPPNQSSYWLCPNHIKAVRELLTLEEA